MKLALELRREKRNVNWEVKAAGAAAGVEAVEPSKPERNQRLIWAWLELEKQTPVLVKQKRSSFGFYYVRSLKFKSGNPFKNEVMP